MTQDNRTEKYQQMHEMLNEKQWRQFLALEAKERGNILLVAREANVSKNTIKAGMKEIEAGDVFSPGKRIRGEGGGRKKGCVAKILGKANGARNCCKDSVSMQKRYRFCMLF